MSTQKRQKQYFEQRKRQQQNVHMMGSDNHGESSGSGQLYKEHQSLDILNLLNLSQYAKECNSVGQKGREDGDVFAAMPGSVSKNQPRISTKVEITVNTRGYEEEKTGAPLYGQIETSPKKVLPSAPDHQNTAFDGPPSHWRTTDQYSDLSVIDLLCDDGHNPAEEKPPTCEDHVSFSLEGLGKVGIETPTHSPQQRARTTYRHSPFLKDGRKTKLQNLSHVLDDIELEVDTMMQDIGVSPISSTFPSNKSKQSSTIIEDHKYFYDHTDKNGPSISKEFFHKSEDNENNEDTWNGFIFPDEKFNKGIGYDTSYENTFQMDRRSPELLKRGAFKMESFGFEDLLPAKWPSSTARKDINMGEPLASFSMDELEDDFNFCGASRTRSYGNFNAKNLIPEDVRDSSSLLSEESSSATAGRGEYVVHSPSIVTGENRRKHKKVFASPKHKYSTDEDKNRSRSNPSKRKPPHYSNSILQEEIGAQNSWQFEEIYASVDRSSVTTSFYQDLEANFSVFGCKTRPEDPFSVFTTPGYKASPSFGGSKNSASMADSPPPSFTSEKFAFDCSTPLPSFPSSPTGPSLSSDFQFKEGPQDNGGFHCETSSNDMSVQGSATKGERHVKLKKDRHNFFEQEDTFMGDNELSSEKKMEVDAPASDNHAQESEGTADTKPKTTECNETSDSPVHVEEISSSLKIPDKHEESQEDNRKSNCDAETETPLKCKITNEEMKISPPEGRNRVNGKHINNQIFVSSGKVMFESYVFHLRVQKVLNGACTTSRRNNTFIGPGSSHIISHHI
ncbi:hypothetical protein MtrunA17_Chr3g0107711 [Medicago truncatula]|uniref:Uncharacterized protein n=2 Tax=Medicago truncatula TaxID=3880 RepID=A0A396IY74_MEDTR|nr:hypothetical protein MtrunA17_Chr3g0107711 [Medicago truncatula]